MLFRKCGRVVCNPCSPHRITIPKAFVVRPTMQAPCYEPPPSRVPDSPGDADYEDNVGQVRITAEPAPRSFNWNSNSGDEDEGMQVRICEQCLGRRPSDSHPGRGVSGPIPGGGGGTGWVSGFLGGDSGGMGVPTPPPGNRDTNRRRRQSVHNPLELWGNFADASTDPRWTVPSTHTPRRHVSRLSISVHELPSSSSSTSPLFFYFLIWFPSVPSWPATILPPCALSPSTAPPK